MICIVEDVDHLLAPVQDQGFDGNGDDVFNVREAKHGVGVHTGRNGEVAVLDVYFGFHGAGFKIDVAREANDFSGEGTADGIDADVEFVAVVDVSDIGLGYRDAEAQQRTLR